MSSLTKRSLILTFARVTNQAILLFSPVFLVRLLSAESYGQYREFVLYAAITSTMIAFGVNRSLPYFVPKEPERQATYITQCILFTLFAYMIGALLIFFGRDLLIASTSFDFAFLLIAYLFFFVNLDFIELYWIAKKRTDLVLYYSSGRALVRLSSVIAAAYFSDDVRVVISVLIAVEALRLLVVAAIVARTPGEFIDFREISAETIKGQMAFFVPLGLVGIVANINKNLGQLIVASQIGASALAFYFIGTYASYFTRLIRGSVADVIFPEMVEKQNQGIENRLRLWRRATTIYLFLMLPVSVICVRYAETIITIAFTSEYLPAIPIFQIFALAILLHCFDFNLPLRLMNRNIFILIGVIIYFSVNLTITLLLLPHFGIIAPAIAYAVSTLSLYLYAAWQTLRLTEINVRKILHWRDVARMFFAALVCLPVLLLDRIPVGFDHILAALTAAVYVAAYLYVVSKQGIGDLDRLFGKIRSIPARAIGRAKGAAS